MALIDSEDEEESFDMRGGMQVSGILSQHDAAVGVHGYDVVGSWQLQLCRDSREGAKVDKWC